MQSKDLRIGNLIQHFDNIEIIDQIGNKEVNEGICDFVKFKNKSTGTWLIHNNMDLVKPIIITEEWLLKLGFNSKTGKHNNLIGRIIPSVEIGYYDFEIQNEIISSYRFVHELQNLYFALTGEELELKSESKP